MYYSGAFTWYSLGIHRKSPLEDVRHQSETNKLFCHWFITGLLPKVSHTTEALMRQSPMVTGARTRKPGTGIVTTVLNTTGAGPGRGQHGEFLVGDEQQV